VFGSWTALYLLHNSGIWTSRVHSHHDSAPGLCNTPLLSHIRSPAWFRWLHRNFSRLLGFVFARLRPKSKVILQKASKFIWQYNEGLICAIKSTHILFRLLFVCVFAVIVKRSASFGKCLFALLFFLKKVALYLQKIILWLQTSIASSVNEKALFSILALFFHQFYLEALFYFRKERIHQH